MLLHTFLVALFKSSYLIEVVVIDVDFEVVVLVL